MPTLYITNRGNPANRPTSTTEPSATFSPPAKSCHRRSEESEKSVFNEADVTYRPALHQI